MCVYRLFMDYLQKVDTQFSLSPLAPAYRTLVISIRIELAQN